MLSNMAMIEGAGVDYYFPLVKHIYSGNAFANRLPLTPLPYQLGQATEISVISVISATGLETRSVKFVFSYL